MSDGERVMLFNFYSIIVIKGVFIRMSGRVDKGSRLTTQWLWIQTSRAVEFLIKADTHRC